MHGQPSRFWRQVWRGLLIATLIVFTQVSGVWSQSPPEAAPVRLNSDILFEVTAAGGLTAQERANTIERQLNGLLEHPDPSQIRVVNREQGPIIFADGNYIMSVTDADAQVNLQNSALDQAQVCQNKIENALSRARLESQQGYLYRAGIKAALALSLALAAHQILGWFWYKRIRPFVANLALFQQASGEQMTGVKLLLRLLLFVLRAGIWFVTLTYVTNLFPLTRAITGTLTEGLLDSLLSRSIPLGSRSYSLLDVLLLAASLFGLVIAASALTNLLKSRFLQVTGISLGAQEGVAILAKYTLIFLGTVVVLQIWGIDLSSLALIASGLGVGIGLGLQNIAKDFVSGLILVFERPIQVGDFVDFDEVMGTVSRIGSRSTEIRTLDHVSIIVPNSRFIETEVINWSHRNAISRIRLPVGVSYSSDPLQVKEALLEACQSNDQILTAPAPQVLFTGFGDSALEFQLVVWISQPNKQIVIKSDLYFAIEACLRKHQIEIPFPQRDLHIRSGYWPAASMTEGSNSNRPGSTPEPGE